ncbi:MAG: hypothetical protein K9W44_01970 [Candidatus Lokiarchaeota archaeon]|nr:hypothetical protein [Candidatus Harpocratesius repetitus]
MINQKIKERMLKLKLTKLDQKLEHELIRSFRSFSEQVKEDINAIDDSPQLLNIIRIGSAFRELCDKIGEDKDHFSKFFRFLEEVRSQDRQMEELIEAFKRKYDFSNPSKFRVEVSVNTQDILLYIQSLISIYDDFQSQKEELKQSFVDNDSSSYNAEKKDYLSFFQKKIQAIKQKTRLITHLTPDVVEQMDDSSSHISRTISSAYYLVHPEQKPENRRLIQDFKKSSPSDILDSFKQPLPFQLEKAILHTFIKDLENKMKDFESQGFIAHIRSFAPLIFAKYEEMVNNFDSSNSFTLNFEEKLQLKNIIRKHYRALEEWLERVNRKYGEDQGNSKIEPHVNPKILKSHLTEYQIKRDQLQNQRENRRIYQHILKQEKLEEKNMKQKSREILNAKKSENSEDQIKNDPDKQEELKKANN